MNCLHQIFLLHELLASDISSRVGGPGPPLDKRVYMMTPYADGLVILNAI